MPSRGRKLTPADVAHMHSFIKRLTAEERYWAKVDKRGPEECWLWTGSVRNRYGAFWYKGRVDNAHRVALHLIGTPIPDKMDVDHTCRCKLCVNPAHLRVVTHRVNSLENSNSLHARNAAKTHCSICGHALGEVVLLVPKRRTNHGYPTDAKVRQRPCPQCYPHARNSRYRIFDTEPLSEGTTR